jgi:NADH-quinone oxidoreductase subunit A
VRGRVGSGARCARRPAGNGSFVPIVPSSARSRRGLWGIGVGISIRRYLPRVRRRSSPRPAEIPVAHGSSLENKARIYSARPRTNPATEARVTEFYRQYLAVAVFVLAAFLMVGAMLGMARLLRPKVPQDEKYITYESGSDPLPLFGQMNVRYYVYALLFVIFDVEAVFIFPWAVNVEPLGWFGLIEMTVFVVVLLLGLAYVWRKGLLKWA